MSTYIPRLFISRVAKWQIYFWPPVCTEPSHSGVVRYLLGESMQSTGKIVIVAFAFYSIQVHEKDICCQPPDSVERVLLYCETLQRRNDWTSFHHAPACGSMEMTFMQSNWRSLRETALNHSNWWKKLVSRELRREANEIAITRLERNGCSFDWVHYQSYCVRCKKIESWWYHTDPLLISIANIVWYFT